MTYAEKRRSEDHCGGCGVFIGKGQKPKLCPRCAARQARYRASTPRKPKIKKGLPKTHRLKSYKPPTRPWRLYLYNEYKRVGMAQLAHVCGVAISSMTAYLFLEVRPLTKNFYGILRWLAISDAPKAVVDDFMDDAKKGVVITKDMAIEGPSKPPKNGI